VISGKKGWLYNEIFEKVKSLELTERVIFTGYLNDKVKRVLLSQAKVFVLPSFWEGFGLEVLESMACKTPVVISKVASLPEIAKDAAVYVNPESAESIANGLLRVLKMDRLEYNNLVRKGLKRIKEFSWQKCARETLNVILDSTK